MRRFLLLWPCLLLLLAACGGASTPATAPPTTAASAPAVAGGNAEPTTQPTPTARKAASTAPSAAPSPRAQAPTAATNQDVALGNVSYYADAQGEIFYIGEVTNTSQSPVAEIKITLQFVDRDGNRLAKATFVNPGLPLLQPGETTPWKLFVGKPPTGWAETKASVELEPLAIGQEAQSFVALTSEGITLAPPGQEGWVTGSGSVLNPTNDPLQGVLLLIGLYDGNGKLLDVGTGITESRQLGGKSKTAFTAEFRNTKQLPSTYKVFAMGTR